MLDIKQNNNNWILCLFDVWFIVSRRTFPSNQRKYKQTRFVVVVGSSHRFGWNGILANASSENILRNEKIGLTLNDSGGRGGRVSIYLESNAALFDDFNWIFFVQSMFNFIRFSCKKCLRI